MANFKDGKGHADKYLDTSRKISTQEMLICNMEALILLFRSNDQCQMTELQNDRQDKNNMPPDLRFQGHKKTGLTINNGFKLKAC